MYIHRYDTLKREESIRYVVDVFADGVYVVSFLRMNGAGSTYLFTPRVVYLETAPAPCSMIATSRARKVRILN